MRKEIGFVIGQWKRAKENRKRGRAEKAEEKRRKREEKKEERKRGKAEERKKQSVLIAVTCNRPYVDLFFSLLFSQLPNFLPS